MLLGGNGNDTLQGGGGAVSLDGGGGADPRLGGADDDAYLVNDAGDGVTEFAAAGIDTDRRHGQRSGERARRQQREQPAHWGNGNDTLIGSGGSGTMLGGGGADSMVGGRMA
jgi:Ca2+-binding RTX toxin-like protein